ncbi:extracellular solute-binding protein (family 3) [Streptomyces sp. KS 21]|nr:extracellular solute-binding protein (family 3) [Streptomyces sp. KS 21]
MKGTRGARPRARLLLLVAALLAVLAGCGKEGSPPYQWLRKEYPRAVLLAYDTYSACVDNLLTYQVDAVSTDDSTLLGYAAKVPDELKAVGRPFSQEPYGIGVPRRDSALRFALDDALEANEKNGNWKKAYEEFLHAGKLIASNLDYDLPFIPVVMIISPICIGMCMPLSWFAGWVARFERRSLKTEAVDVAEAEPGTVLPGGPR